MIYSAVTAICLPEDENSKNTNNLDGDGFSSGNEKHKHNFSENKVSIILVEDNAGDAFLVRKLFTKSFFAEVKLIHLETLQDALSRKDEVLDAILLDLNLPDSVGEATFNAIKKKFPDVPVVVLTGLADKETARNLLDKGAYGFMR